MELYSQLQSRLNDPANLIDEEAIYSMSKALEPPYDNENHKKKPHKSGLKLREKRNTKSHECECSELRAKLKAKKLAYRTLESNFVELMKSRNDLCDSDTIVIQVEELQELRKHLEAISRANSLYQNGGSPPLPNGLDSKAIHLTDQQKNLKELVEYCTSNALNCIDKIMNKNLK
jgi:hypothetical protein